MTTNQVPVIKKLHQIAPVDASPRAWNRLPRLRQPRDVVSLRKCFQGAWKGAIQDCRNVGTYQSLQGSQRTCHRCQRPGAWHVQRFQSGAGNTSRLGLRVLPSPSLKSYNIKKLSTGQAPKNSATLKPLHRLDPMTPTLRVGGQGGSTLALFCPFLTLTLDLTLGSFRVNILKVIHSLFTG